MPVTGHRARRTPSQAIGSAGLKVYHRCDEWRYEGNGVIRCGVDMIECERIAQGIERFGERFLRRFFTPGERQDCHDSPPRLAARFAAKEAVAKAIGTGIGDMRWVEIEIRTDGPRRRPRLLLHGDARRLADELGLSEWDISLSHTGSHAIAIAVAAQGG